MVRRIDVVLEGNRVSDYYLASYENGRRYLFPFRGDGHRGRTYTFAAHFRGGAVVEEYAVSGNQIVYEAYGSPDRGRVPYFCINYVKGGKYPVLGEAEGYFTLSPLEYVQTKSSVWYQQP